MSHCAAFETNLSRAESYFAPRASTFELLWIRLWREAMLFLSIGQAEISLIGRMS